MTVFARLLKPVRQAAAAFFQHDLAVRREDGAVRIVLQPRAAEPASAGGAVTQSAGPRNQAAIQQERREREQLGLILPQLADLLNSLPETRGTMRHLAFVEQALATKGLRALHTLPVDVLQRALEQIENLVTNWSPAGLANLRSKMAVAVNTRGHGSADGAAETHGDAERSVAMLDQEVDAAGLRMADPAQQPEAHAEAEDAALAAAYAAYATFSTAVPAAAHGADDQELRLVLPPDVLHIAMPPASTPSLPVSDVQDTGQVHVKTGNSLQIHLPELHG